MANYTFKYRLYPNKNQKERLKNHFGCCRYIYNTFLYKRKIEYENTKNTRHYFDDRKEIKILRQQHKWLKLVSHECLKYELIHLQQAYENFFRKCKLPVINFPPKFKKKTDKQSFTISGDHCRFKNNRVYVLKFQDGIKIKLHRPIIGQIKQITISLNKAEQYYIYFTVNNIEKSLPYNSNMVGIDLNINRLVCSDNSKFHFDLQNLIEFNKLKFIKRKIKRCQQFSNQYNKLMLQKNKIQNRICNIICNTHHNISKSIIVKNQNIILEDINWSKMIANCKNIFVKRALIKSRLGTLAHMIEYKSRLYNRHLYKISTFAPTTKQCSGCGYIKSKMKLETKIYKCNVCNLKIDRDLNAAMNIYNFGKSACGTRDIAGCLDSIELSNGSENTNVLVHGDRTKPFRFKNNKG